MTRERVLVALGVISFAVGFAALAALQHRAFSTGRFDVGNLTQAVWSSSHGHLLSITDLQGRQISRLGAHFDPALLVFVPLWWLWPDPQVLLVAQAAAIALGAIPLFLLARRHLASERAACCLGLAYLLYPATGWLAVDDFHPVALATPLLLAAILFLDQGRLLQFALCAGLACTTKEHIGVTVAGLGVWYALARGHRLAGAAIAAAGLGMAALATQVIVPHFAPGGGSPFAGRYAGVGGSPARIVKTVFTDPGAIVGALAEGRDLRYLGALVLPLLCVSLLSPALATVALPELLLNVLSSTPTQASIHFHYTAAMSPVLLAAAALGLGRLRARHRVRRLAPPALVVSTLLAGVVLGPMPQWRHVPLGSKLGTREHVVTAHARAAARAVAVVPPGEPVSATNALGAHLSARRRVFSFPVVAEARWIAVDTQRPSFLDRAADPAAFATALARVEASGRFRRVFERDGILVLRLR